MQTGDGPHIVRRSSGLTLVEVLVVVAILGLMALGITPAVQVIFQKTQNDDVEARLKDSWALALAYAQSQQQPVVWVVQNGEKGAQIQVRTSSGKSLSRILLPRIKLIPPSETPASAFSGVQLLVYPHGLIQPAELRWQASDGEHHLTFPAADPPRAASNAGVS